MTATQRRRRARSEGWKRQMQSPWVRVLGALFFVLLLGMIFNNGGAFFEWTTHRDMLRQVSVYAILACGLTLVVITGGIDLAVGSVLGFTAVLFSVLSIHWGWSPWLTIPACLAMGLVLGSVSGGLVARLGMQPFIATLAMMVFARGLAKWASGGQKVSQAVIGSDGNYQYVELPAIFSAIDARILWGQLSVVTVILLVCVAACWILLRRLRWGRYFYAIGGNEEASRLSGVSVRRVKLIAYALSGFFAAVAGICQAAQEQQGDPEGGVAYELTAIAMVVIGGTSLMGGTGGIGLTLIGALTIGYLDKILSLNAVSEASRLMLTGVIIVAAVILQNSRREA